MKLVRRFRACYYRLTSYLPSIADSSAYPKSYRFNLLLPHALHAPKRRQGMREPIRPNLCSFASLQHVSAVTSPGILSLHLLAIARFPVLLSCQVMLQQ